MNDQLRDQPDPGAAIGRTGERAADTIPGGVGRRDERVAAHSTRPTGAGDPARRGQASNPPSGHRDGPAASDDEVREAGENG